MHRHLPTRSAQVGGAGVGIRVRRWLMPCDALLLGGCALVCDLWCHLAMALRHQSTAPLPAPAVCRTQVSVAQGGAGSSYLAIVRSTLAGERAFEGIKVDPPWSWR